MAAGKFIWLVATVAVIAGLPGAASPNEHQAAAPPAAQTLWPPVPDVRGLTLVQAISRLQASGWRPSVGANPSRGGYLLRSPANSVVRPRWGTVACGSVLTFGYALEVAVAKSRADCRASLLLVPPFMAFRREAGWVAAWGVQAHIELWSPRVGFRSVWGDLGGGSCDRPTRSRVFHFGGVGPRLEFLRRSRWHLLVTGSRGSSERDDDRERGLCVTHDGRQDYVANHAGVPDDTLRRRVSGTRVAVDFGQEKWNVRVSASHAGRATAVIVRGPASEGSSPIGAHVRPGTCRRVSGPEYPFILNPDENVERAEGDVIVPVAFSAFLSRPHVLELHGFADNGAGVKACARISQ